MLAQQNQLIANFTFVSKEVDGTIGGLQSKVVFDKVDIAKSIIEGSAEVKTLDTGNFLRDGHLMWKKYFNEKAFPLIKFRSTSITLKTDTTYEVVADLFIKGKSNPIKAMLTIKGNTASLEFILYCSDWDIVIDKERENNKVEVRIDFPLKS